VVCRTRVSSAVFRDREESTRSDHPPGLTEEGGPVRHVHRDVLGVAAVKRSVAVWQGLTVPLSQVDHCPHPEQLRQPPAGVDERPSHVDAADPATEAPGEVARRPPEPATHVEQVVPGPRWKGVAKLDRGR
jgi:hypothetical protein